MALVSIDELMGRSFHIPSYQRGYRWGKVEVEALLNDLKEFYLSNPKTDEFYCLQPIVLYNNPENHEKELLDGQQRLTTLYLLLVYLEETRKAMHLKKESFSLTYATRSGSKNFLETCGFKTITSSNRFDYYYMSQAYQCIEKWFAREENNGLEGEMARLLLQQTGRGANVRVIEYELQGDDSKPIEVFLRLNQGKIPLTDAELVKALLLQKDKFLPKADKKEVNMEAIQAQLDLIATEWYDIECALAERDRWAFIAPKNNSAATRIDLILQLTAKQFLNSEKYKGKLSNVFDKELGYKYPCYVIFSEIIKQRSERIDCIKEIWEHVRRVYEFINEWYNENTLYHYIGFLLCEEVITLESLLEKAIESKHPDFKNYLLKKISGALGDKSPESLFYEDEDGKKDDYATIKRLLLLHNIYWCVNPKNKDKLRFSFSAYREKDWSLEHITPQNPKAPSSLEKVREWVNNHLASLKNREETEEKKMLVEALEAMKKDLESRLNKEKWSELLENFKSLFRHVLAYEQKLPDTDLHSLSNLCLLDRPTNSSLSNNSFDVKREIVRTGGVKNAYIPPATRQVFLKGFSTYPQNNYSWDEADAEAYLKNINKTYNYFKEEER